MNLLRDLLILRARVQKNRRPPNSERAYWVDETAKNLKKPFKQILGQTRNWPVEWIKEMYLHCEKAENFGRLWWGLIKKSKDEKSKLSFGKSAQVRRVSG